MAMYAVSHNGEWKNKKMVISVLFMKINSYYKKQLQI